MRKYLLTACLVALPLTANSALLERLGGLAYYDDVADLTWLADANAAVGSVYDTYNPGSGRMEWVVAKAWAASLDVAGVTGWRLPESDTCFNYDCIDSEMGNLFYNVLGGRAGVPIVTIHNNNYNLFNNVQSYTYWSATEYVPDTLVAWDFGMSNGYQAVSGKLADRHAWAVQSGDVSAVPIPAAAWLFTSGLIGLIGLARRKHN